MEELRLIEQARAGDREAFCRIYGEYKDRLYRYAFYRLGNREDAEDAVSECVLSAWKQIRSLRDPQTFPAWIFRILSGCCGALIRKAMADRERQEALNAEAALQTAEDGPSEKSLMLMEAMGELTEEEQEIVLLSVVAGLKSREIGEITGKAAGTIRSSQSRSLAKMRAFMEG